MVILESIVCKSQHINEIISHHLIDGDVVEHECPIGNQLPHEMIADINMSRSLVINRVFGQRKGIHIIIMNSRGPVQLLA